MTLHKVALFFRKILRELNMANQKQFTDFLKDIEPSRTTKNNARSAHTTVRKILREHNTFKKVHLKTFLSGSYRRSTAIRPQVKNSKVERPDVDIIVVTNHTRDDKPKEVLKLLYNTLNEKYDSTRLQARSVGITTKLVDMDVVPIIAPQGIDETLYIPDRKLEQWLETNPPKHTKWTTKVNKKAGKHFKPLVKLMKWWRRTNPTISKRPKGFVIECIVAECMDYDESQYEDLFLGTLETIVKRYESNISFEIVPCIADPGVPDNSVTKGMTFAAFEGFYNKVKEHATLGRLAQQEKDEDKALEKWRKIFGYRFPSAATKKSESLLRAAVIPESLTFPNQAIMPKKPGGFA